MEHCSVVLHPEKFLLHISVQIQETKDVEPKSGFLYADWRQE